MEMLSLMAKEVADAETRTVTRSQRQTMEAAKGKLRSNISQGADEIKERA